MYELIVLVMILNVVYYQIVILTTSKLPSGD